MFRGSQIVKTGREHRHSPGFKKSLVMGELGGRHFWPVSKQVTVRARADCPGLLMPTLLCPYLDCSPSSGSHHQPLCIPRKDQSQRVSSQGQQWFSEPGLHLSCPWPLTATQYSWYYSDTPYLLLDGTDNDRELVSHSLFSSSPRHRQDVEYRSRHLLGITAAGSADRRPYRDMPGAISLYPACFAPDISDNRTWLIEYPTHRTTHCFSTAA